MVNGKISQEDAEAARNFGRIVELPTWQGCLADLVIKHPLWAIGVALCIEVVIAGMLIATYNR